ncbi:MAG: TonB-dependent receptor, partial [Wenzhouxiangellaceae bacterium]
MFLCVGSAAWAQSVDAEPNVDDEQGGAEIGADLDRIVVTAQFREQAPIEVPIAVTAYDQTFLDDTGLDQLDSLSSYVPGLLVQEQSVNNPGFVIRGITSDDGASNIEPRVSVFQNGVSIARSRGSFVELFDLERIEVMKGPQGTLFGRNAQIGAVHMISHKPVYQTEARAKAEFGNFDQRWVEAMVNAPLVENTLAFRAAAVYRKRDGYLENLTGEDLNGTDTAALRASLRWDPAPGARVDLIANYSEDSPPGTSFKSGVIPALGGDTNPNRAASLNTFGGLIGGRDL